MVDTVLTRLSSLDPSSNREMTLAQEKADLIVYSFKDQLTDPILIASQLVGAGVYGLFRMGTLRLFRPAKVITEGLVELGEEAPVLRNVAGELRELRTFEKLESPVLNGMRPAIPFEKQKRLLELEELIQRRAQLNTEWKELCTEYREGARYMLGHIVGIPAGSEAFDLTRRSLLSLSGEGSKYPNLWKWEYKRDGMSAGMAQSVFSVGIPLWWGFTAGGLFFSRSSRLSWGIAGAAGTAAYLLGSLMNHPSSKRNDMCWDRGKDVCQ